MSAGRSASENFVNYFDIDRAYEGHFAYKFVMRGLAPGDSRLLEAALWCEEMWGPAVTRTWMPSGVLCPLDGDWNYLTNRFYFKTEAACVLFQLRWR